VHPQGAPIDGWSSPQHEPELAQLCGNGDHDPPHFHAIYQGRKVEIDIRTLAVLDAPTC